MSALVLSVPESKPTSAADQAALRLMHAPDFLPPCPNCSLRSIPPRYPTFYRARGLARGYPDPGVTLYECCELSKGSPIIRCAELPVSGLIAPDARQAVIEKQWAARKALANWWKMRRLISEEDRPCRDMARRNRNRELLALFRERGLTPDMEATK